jgi:hypothetical protein
MQCQSGRSGRYIVPLVTQLRSHARRSCHRTAQIINPAGTTLTGAATAFAGPVPVNVNLGGAFLRPSRLNAPIVVTAVIANQFGFVPSWTAAPAVPA